MRWWDAFLTKEHEQHTNMTILTKVYEAVELLSYAIHILFVSNKMNILCLSYILYYIIHRGKALGQFEAILMARWYFELPVIQK